MEKRMKKIKLPKTDSIQKLAQFWDTHDLTSFEDELEELKRPVFARVAPTLEIKLSLDARETKALEQIAHASGLSIEELVRTWVQKKLPVRAIDYRRQS